MKVEYVDNGYGNGFVHCKGVDVIVKHLTKFAAKASKIINDNDWILQVDHCEGTSYEFSLQCGKKVKLLRTVNLHTGYYEHDTFVVDDEFKGKGLVKLMYQSTISICEELNIKKVITSAILDGCVVWLLRGFIPFNIEKYFNDLENVGLNVDHKLRNEYWFTRENIKANVEYVSKVNWHGYAMVEEMKKYI